MTHRKLIGLVVVVFVAGAGSPALAQNAVNFDGTNDYITMGTASGLGTATFTLEAWIRRDGASWGSGTNGSTGTGGLNNVVAIIAKGRSEGDGTNVDCNYFFGMDPTNGRLVADFEQATAGPGGWAAGLNHPMCSSATISDQDWHHVAVTYDKTAGKGWRFYIDGVDVTAANGSSTTCGAVSTCTDLTACVQNPGVDPRSDSIQHFALGVPLPSSGSATGGYFGGIIDEARVWNIARTQAEIVATMNQEVSSAANLIGRWGLNEGSGTTAGDSTTPSENGTLTNGPAWTTGAPSLSGNLPPNAPTVVTPQDGETGAPTSPSLTVNVVDPEDAAMTVTFFGRPANPNMEDFTIVVLPDTQYYSQTYPAIYAAQLEWIRDNRESRNIVFVTQLGDCVNNQDDAGQEYQWTNASAAWDLIESPNVEIPYGIAVGNHDNGGNARSGANEGATTIQYTKFFGLQRFCPGTCSNNAGLSCEKDADCVSPGICNPGASCKSWFGGRYDFGDPVTYFRNTDNHYELFSAGGMDFIAFHLEWDCADGSMGCASPGVAHPTRAATIAWMDNILTNVYPNRRAMISSHFLLQPSGNPPAFSNQGQAVYDAVKDNSNVFMMLCGHLDQANRRTDSFGGGTIHSMISDYQTRPNGGRGWMRTLTFSPSTNNIHVQTFSPWANYPSLPRQEQLINSHADNTAGTAQNEFDLAYVMTASFQQIGSPVTGVASGTNASVSWPGLEVDTLYEWYVTVSDGTNTVTGPVWSFMTTCTDDASCDDGNPCTDDTCNNGTCEYANNSDSCDDGNACTINDTCSLGVCAGTNSSAACDDGNLCTTGDTCSGGSCVGTPVVCNSPAVCSAASGLCEVTVTFQQGVSGYTGAKDTFLNAGAPGANNSAAVALVVDAAPDVQQALLEFGGIFGNGAGQIPPGATILSASLTINVTNASAVGASLHRMLQAWNDTDSWSTFSTGGGGIQAGVEAAATADVSSLFNSTGSHTFSVTNSVQAWHANPASNFGWAWLPPAQDDSWQFGSCEATTAANRPRLSVTFSVSQPCTVNGDCDDNNACNGVETCNTGLGICQNGTPPNCNDNNPCTSDSCHAVAGCQFANNTDPCDDGDACTSADACVAGSCEGTPIPECCVTAADCDDNDVCTVDSCSTANVAGLSFDGVNDYVDLGTAASLNNFGTNSFTIEGWLYTNGGNADRTSVVRLGRQGDFMQAVVQLTGTAAPYLALAGSVETDGTGGQVDVNYQGTAITPNEWHHFAMIVDRSTLPGNPAGQQLRLHIDGGAAIVAGASAWGTTTTSSTDAALLGTGRLDTGALSLYYDGFLDEVRIWDGVRTLSEIQNNMFVQIESAPGLRARWGMNEGAGTTIADSAGGHTGTLTNGTAWTTSPLPNLGSNQCSHVSIPNCCDTAADCEDGDVCTFDQCVANLCTNTPIAPPDCCHNAGECNDADICTIDSCVDNVCDYASVPDCCVTDEDCDDGGVCTIDACADGNFAAVVCDGVDDYVTMGAATGLNAATFTVEFWFKRTGTGVSATTGTGGIPNFLPMVCKGAGEGESPANINANYVIGLNTSGNVLAGDFEDTINGGNHPVSGTTTISNNVWYHAAATYDGTTWRLYLNGNPEATLVVGSFSPESTSIQHFGFCSMLSSTGARSGFFAGQLDEIRVWNVVRSQAQIAANMNRELYSGSGLVGRWGIEESSGTTVLDSALPAQNGTLSAGATRTSVGIVNLGTPNTCEYVGVPGCCVDDGDCDDGNLCTDDSCVSNTCQFATISNCCNTVADCNDNSNCTTETCTNNECEYTYSPAPGCCQTASQCNDGLECTADACPNSNTGGLTFDGTNDYVTMGAAAGTGALGASTFTLEAWIYWTGGGATTSTGTAGIGSIIPIITKGRGEADGSNLDANYHFGLSGGRLAADFEQFGIASGTGQNAPGLNRPVCGTTTVTTNTWHHVAAVYDGCWRLYLNGVEETLNSTCVTGASDWEVCPRHSATASGTDNTVVAVPRFDSMQHFGLGTAMTSAGTTQGFFQGRLDEVRVWNVSRTGAQIASNRYTEIPTATGLIGRWGLNHSSGTTATDSTTPAENGTLTNFPASPWITDPALLPPFTECQNVPVISGTPCGSNSDTVCDNPDSCDGAGVCLSNHEPDLTGCTPDANECTNDICSAGVCVHPNSTAGTACGSASATECDDPDTCDGAGACQVNHWSDGADCDDGLFCNGADGCLAGVCSQHDGDPCSAGPECANSCNETADHCFDPSGTPCTDDGNVCTDNECDGAGSCVAIDNSEPCDDQDPCTEDDVCLDGVCAGDPIPGCVDCVVASECDDGNECTVDTCVDHVCVNTPSLVGTPCTDDGNVCTDNVCNGSGVCVPLNNSASCNDGLFCNGADTCAGGTCSIHAGDPCLGGNECSDVCNEAADHCFDPSGTPCTDDGNVCTNNVCNGSGACVALNNSASCNDGLFCNGADTCAGGTCSIHAGDPCLGGNECSDVCNEAADHCFDPSGTPCTDDGNVCTDNVCNGSGACVAINNSASCNDGLFCNGVDSCAGGTCSIHAGNPCTGGNECSDACNEAADHCFDPSGTPCTDDGNVCTNNVCNGSGACVAINNSASCNDGLFCNGADTCAGGTCSIHAGNPCTGGNECSDACNEAADHCFDPSGTPCTDDGNVCTNNVCNGSGVCVPLNNSASCNDGLFCNGADTCAGGTCSIHAGNPCLGGNECSDVCNEAADHCFDPSGTPCTDDGNVCTDNECNGSGACVALNNTQPCNDGNACTTVDICSGGSCVGSSPLVCNDMNVCTTDSCVPAIGCVFNPVTNGTSCDDGLFCNGVDTCQSGTCTVGSPSCPSSCQTCMEASDECRWCILDIDQNGGMGTGDFSFFAGCFGSCYPPQHACSMANFDQDPNNCAGTGDFAGFAGCFGLSCAQCANCNALATARADLAAQGSVSMHTVVLQRPSTADVADRIPRSLGSVVTGTPFVIEIWAFQGAVVQSRMALASAYVDLLYDDDLIEIQSIDASELFPLFPSVFVHPKGGIVESIGGCIDLALGNNSGAKWVRVATIHARSVKSGVAVLNLSAPVEPLGVSILSQFGNLGLDQIQLVGQLIQVEASRMLEKSEVPSRAIERQ